MTEPFPPDLDDLRFQPLVDAAKQRLHAQGATWTDHNVSDPGITLLEAFAYHVDHLGYRANRVPRKAVVDAILALAKPDLTDPAPDTLLPARSVTPADLADIDGVTLKCDDTPHTCIAVEYTPNRAGDTTFSFRVARSRPGAKPADDVCTSAIRAYFTSNHRELPLGTEFGILAAGQKKISITAQVIPTTPVDTTLKDRLEAAVRDYLGVSDFAPPQRIRLWPVGRPLYAEEIYRLLAGMPGVTEVASVQLAPAEAGNDQYADPGADGVFVVSGLSIQLVTANSQ
ncbi:hypothetical protein ACFVVA_42010 [Kitasatospora sp. NPDC058048]|uniref:hypothetical protein n=1 Tax=Kitasatospora sp. NPDC058048 TaxID=3346313 RepID=UPI0036DE48EB